MVTTCAHSAKLVLPSLLRHIFRSEFAAELPSSHQYRSILPPKRTPHVNRNYQHLRHFSNCSRVASSQTPSPASSGSEAQGSPKTNPNNIEKNPTEGKKFPRSPSPSDVEALSTKSQRGVPRSSHQVSDQTAERKQRFSGERKLSGLRQKKKKEGWQIQKAALKTKFEDGWNPPKKLSPDAMDGIRHLHSVSPDRFTTPVLAEQFQVSPEAIRRILKSKWRPSEAEAEGRRQRWEKRHDRIWGHLSELGLRPPTKRTKEFSGSSILYDSPDKSTKGPK